MTWNIDESTQKTNNKTLAHLPVVWLWPIKQRLRVWISVYIKPPLDLRLYPLPYMWQKYFDSFLKCKTIEEWNLASNQYAMRQHCTNISQDIDTAPSICLIKCFHKPSSPWRKREAEQKGRIISILMKMHHSRHASIPFRLLKVSREKMRCRAAWTWHFWFDMWWPVLRKQMLQLLFNKSFYLYSIWRFKRTKKTHIRFLLLMWCSQLFFLASSHVSVVAEVFNWNLNNFWIIRFKMYFEQFCSLWPNHMLNQRNLTVCIGVLEVLMPLWRQHSTQSWSFYTKGHISKRIIWKIH